MEAALSRTPVLLSAEEGGRHIPSIRGLFPPGGSNVGSNVPSPGHLLQRHLHLYIPVYCNCTQGDTASSRQDAM